MINTNISSNNPFLLKPVGKDYLWGGNRLNDDFAKDIELSPLAETWECSVHPDGTSIVASGEFEERTLKSVLSEHPEFLGRHKELPILIKLIDAKQDLSIQVHPDDAYATEHEHDRGKTEMWYVLDATKDAELIYGLKCDLRAKQIEIAIEAGTLEQYLQRVPVVPNDLFFIPAGTIHAIGAGCLVAEIQESSNVTYRLYDYNRIDKNGLKRPLHVEKALKVADLKAYSNPRQPMRTLKYIPGMARELLKRCQYFEVYRMLINTERIRSMVEVEADEFSFRVLLCYKGCGCAFLEDRNVLKICKGDCVFIPAGGSLWLHGRMELIDVRC